MPDDFEAWIRTELTERLSRKLEDGARRLLPKVRELVGQGMVGSRHYHALRNGSLREVFGLAEPQSLLDEVVVAVQNSVVVTVAKPDQGSLGGFVVGAFAADFSDAMAVASTAVRQDGTSIDWLRLLLFGGDRVLFSDPTASNGPARGLMVPRQRQTDPIEAAYRARFGRAPFGGWRVPPEFAGNEIRNWLTEVADAVGPQVNDLVNAELRRL